ncbi:Aldo/keto reductase [Collybia nuda]|uniref:Aldo/keto reductase n=1 Tax=Collybia nuda TaxID=64659 RepID=A0A9P5Y7Z6_9AGAR|nr:Aldo/keto reductase [Collybia nuda]
MGGPGGGDEVREMCSTALRHGYRLLDTASGYANEAEVGHAIRESGIPRAEIFVTTKLPNTAHHKVRESFDQSLKDLGCDYIDLYLLHWPQAMLNAYSMADPKGRVPLPNESPTFIETWKEMEKLLSTGKVKTIGVSNFSIKTLSELLPHCTIIPAVNQVELHPYLPQHNLKGFCNDKGILLTAYSSLGQNSNVLYEGDSTIKRIASDLKVTPAQILLSWAVQNGIVVVPKSANEDRMVTNITLATIPENDMRIIDDIHKQPGKHRSLVWSQETDEVFGWKYEWMGWDISKGGLVSDH